MKIVRIVILLMIMHSDIVRAGGIPVIDAASIAQDQQNHLTEYVEMIEQTMNQIEQITNQVEQIQQMYDYLERFGDPSQIADMLGMDKLLGILTGESFWDQEKDVLDGLEGAEIFDYDGRGVYDPIGDTVKIGDAEYDRDGEFYRGEAAIIRQVDHYQTAYEDIWVERQAFKEEIALTAAALESAKDDAEVQKYSALLKAQSAQLLALDNELIHASNALQARKVEAEARKEIEKKAAVEAQQAAWDELAKKTKGGGSTADESVKLIGSIKMGK